MLNPVHARLVVARGAFGLRFVLGMAHGDEREGRNAARASQGYINGGHAILLRRDAEPHGAQAQVGGLDEDVLHGSAHVVGGVLRRAQALGALARHNDAGGEFGRRAVGA